MKLLEAFIEAIKIIGAVLLSLLCVGSTILPVILAEKFESLYFLLLYVIIFPVAITWLLYNDDNS